MTGFAILLGEFSLSPPLPLRRLHVLHVIAFHASTPSSSIHPYTLRALDNRASPSVFGLFQLPSFPSKVPPPSSFSPSQQHLHNHILSDMTSPANLQPTYAPAPAAPTSGVPSQAPVSTRFMPSFANANLARSLLMGSSNRNDPEVVRPHLSSTDCARGAETRFALSSGLTPLPLDLGHLQCQTYTCCGVDLGSMSNLLQHVRLHAVVFSLAPASFRLFSLAIQTSAYFGL